MFVITVTPNVAIDQTVHLDHLRPGEVHRAKSVSSNAGGKGVNVSSCLADWGVSSSLSGFLGKENAAVFEELCAAKKLDDQFVRVDGTSRTNVKIVDDAGTTDINLPGVNVGARDVAELQRRVAGLAEKDGLVFLCGSLPPGCPRDFYAGMTADLSGHGARVVLDASEDALTMALDSRALPFAIKPNRDELSAWAGRDLRDEDELTAVVRSLHERGIGLVVVSLGEEGALFSREGTMLYAKLHAERLESTTGAGDAMVAGIGAALAEQADPERMARLATAFAVGKLSMKGPNLPVRARVEELAGLVDIRKVR